MNTSFRPQRANRRRAAGFSLIEVLVSIVVLSFGLLGMVGLQAASIQANRDARLQSTATTLARELAEMMRGNKDNALLTTATNPYLVPELSHPLVAPTPSYCLVVGSACTTTLAVGQAQMTDWLARVDDALPGAHVAICRDNAPYDAATGDPTWICTSTSNDDQIVIKIGWTQNTLKSGDAALDQHTKPSIVVPVTAGSGTL